MEHMTQSRVRTDGHNYGIDLLKIISMMMIPVLHVLGHGGILKSSAPLSSHNLTAWFLEIAAFCAVNSYALISGYLSYGKRQKYSNIIYLYLQVVFYTVATTAVFRFYQPELVGRRTVFKAFFPFAYNTYWYFTAYFCLFFFIPFLNRVIDTLEKDAMRKLLLTCFLIFSVLPTLFHYDFPYTKGGYCFLWLAVLYIVGGAVKKYGIPFHYRNPRNLLGYVICVVITWLSKVVIEFVTQKVFNEPKGGDYLISYTSPTIIFCSIFLLCFFLQIKCGRRMVKFIQFFAPVSFGVYLFHEEPLFRDTFMNNGFIRYLSFPPPIMALAVIATALGIWLIGSLIDRIRLAVFDLLKIKQLCILAENKLNVVFVSLARRCQGKMDAARK